MFGDTIYLGKIPEADWVSNICKVSQPPQNLSDDLRNLSELLYL